MLTNRSKERALIVVSTDTYTFWEHCVCGRDNLTGEAKPTLLAGIRLAGCEIQKVLFFSSGFYLGKNNISACFF